MAQPDLTADSGLISQTSSATSIQKSITNLVEGVICQQEAEYAKLQLSCDEKSKLIQKLEGNNTKLEADNAKFQHEFEKLKGVVGKLEAELQQKCDEHYRQMQKLQGEVADLHLKYAAISEYVEPFRKSREVARQSYLLPPEEESEQQQLFAAAARKPRPKTARKERQVPETGLPKIPSPQWNKPTSMSWKK